MVWGWSQSQLLALSLCADVGLREQRQGSHMKATQDLGQDPEVA